jgi:hypothetical protein
VEQTVQALIELVAKHKQPAKMAYLEVSRRLDEHGEVFAAGLAGGTARANSRVVSGAHVREEDEIAVAVCLRVTVTRAVDPPPITATVTTSSRPCG